MKTSFAIEQDKERITARVPLNVYETLQRAASLIGVPLNSFMVQAALKEAQDYIDRHDMKIIELSAESSVWFIKQLETPKKPNKRLQKAVSNYREKYQQNENTNIKHYPK